MPEKTENEPVDVIKSSQTVAIKDEPPKVEKEDPKNKPVLKKASVPNPLFMKAL